MEPTESSHENLGVRVDRFAPLETEAKARSHDDRATGKLYVNIGWFLLLVMLVLVFCDLFGCGLECPESMPYRPYRTDICCRNSTQQLCQGHILVPSTRSGCNARGLTGYQIAAIVMLCFSLLSCFLGCWYEGLCSQVNSQRDVERQGSHGSQGNAA